MPSRVEAYLYPIKGIYYFATHPELRKPLKDQFAPIVTTAVSVTTSMFTFAYAPQAFVLALVSGPFAIVSTILLVLSEIAALSGIISRVFFLQDALVDTFDATLLQRNKATLVSKGRELKPARGSTSKVIGRMGKLIKSPFGKFTPTAIFRYIMYLPLNGVPLIGPGLYVVMQGRKSGPNAHARYFQLKGMTQKEQDAWVDQRRAAYTSFGILATLLEMIPFAGIFFSFTNSIGAALWAADMEDGTPPPETAQLKPEELPEQETGVIEAN